MDSNIQLKRAVAQCQNLLIERRVLAEIIGGLPAEAAALQRQLDETGSKTMEGFRPLA